MTLDAIARRRQGYKRCKISDQETRREAALKRQKESRRDRSALARSLVFSTDVSFSIDHSMEFQETTDRNQSSSQVSRQKSREDRLIESRSYYSMQLLNSEWMLDVPTTLNMDNIGKENGWLVIPRPEGKRCLVISHRGTTIARLQSGCILNTFPSDLPNGRRRHCAGNEIYCILDCIFHEPDNTYYVLDLMCWKGYSLYDCTVEFRFSWLLSKLQEISADIVSSKNPYRFLPLPFYECNAEGITSAYELNFPYIKDGLLFYAKQGHYDMELTPLVLTWKDAKCSRYFVFSDVQTIVLIVLENGNCCTLEKISLYNLSEEEIEKNEIVKGDLVRFSISGASYDCNGNPVVNNIQYQRRCSIKRGLADSWSKILFQYNARSGGLRIEEILASVISNEEQENYDINNHMIE